MEGFLVLLCVVLLLLVPKFKQLSGLECLNLFLFFDEVITGIEPRIELIKGSLVITALIDISVPSLHLRQSILKLLFSPHKQHLMRLLMLT